VSPATRAALDPRGSNRTTGLAKFQRAASSRVTPWAGREDRCAGMAAASARGS